MLTLDQARKKATTYLGKVASHEDPQDEADQRRASSTVKEVVEVYIEQHAKKKKRSWKEDQSRLKRFLLPEFGTRLAPSLVSADMEKLHSTIGADYPYAANRFLENVRKVFNWARVAGLVPKDHLNPAVGSVKFPERKRKRFLTTVEMPRFIASLEQEDSEYAKHGIWLLLLLGVRSIELLKAKWEDIDWDMGTLFIGLTKNGEPLLAPISEAAMARLKMIPRMAGNPYILCGRKSGRYLSELGTALKRVMKRAGIENLRIHDLRRTVGSWLAQNGHTLHLIGDVLNHRDPKTTAGYAYFQTQQRRDALSGHGERVLTLAAPHLRAPTAPTSVSAATLLPPEDVGQIVSANAEASRHRHYFKRETLYDLVWMAPVSEIARRLGVSDVGLAKLCRRASIPLPGRGYWGRVESGQQIGRAHV